MGLEMQSTNETTNQMIWYLDYAKAWGSKYGKEVLDFLVTDKRAALGIHTLWGFSKTIHVFTYPTRNR